MTEWTIKDTDVFNDIHEAVLGDWRGFVTSMAWIAGLVFISLHVGVKFGYALAFVDFYGYPPSELTGQAKYASNVFLAVGGSALVILASSYTINCFFQE